VVVTLVDRQPFGGPVTVESAGVRHIIGAELAHVVLCAPESAR
jgi:Fe2+ transport system protein FeoA